jgi:hypothetical protein
LVIEFAATIGELSDDRRCAEDALVDVDQVDAPLVRLRVVETQRLRLDVLSLAATVDFEFFEIGIAVEYFLVTRNAIIFDSLGRAGQPVRPPDMSLPIADQKIEVMGSIAGRCGWRRRRISLHAQKQHQRRQRAKFGECAAGRHLSCSNISNRNGRHAPQVGKSH